MIHVSLPEGVNGTTAIEKSITGREPLGDSARRKCVLEEEGNLLDLAETFVELGSDCRSRPPVANRAFVGPSGPCQGFLRETNSLKSTDHRSRFYCSR